MLTAILYNSFPHKKYEKLMELYGRATQYVRPNSIDAIVHTQTKRAVPRSLDQYLDHASDTKSEGTLKRMYDAFLNSEFGQVAQQYARKAGLKNPEGKVEDYKVLDMGKGAIAAVITTPWKKVLAAGKRYLKNLVADPVEQLYTMMHEYFHAAGEHSEVNTEKNVMQAAREGARHYTGKLKDTFQKIGKIAEGRLRQYQCAYR